ncbi:MAG: phospholipid carrier-dependent glycosyltransferase, partial [Nitrosopumilaceae archaeon]|nr:glycosyltransferase family 39 protein [Nitrosopumilaceae archaeon]NIX62343.1 phospholipid carrier-dependent glycosyltransferase [Nitrosopumilaceae archaeon]
MTKKNFLCASSLLLLAIIITAFLLRIWGITFDLPHVSHPDEPNEVHRALRLGAGNFEIERVGKGGYYYLLFIEYGVFFIILKLLGIITSVKGFMLYFFKDPTYFYIIGRTTTVFIGTLNVWLTYLIGKKVKGENVGLIAAIFMAFSNVNVLHAHYITVDVPMTACVLATVYFALKIYETDQLRNYILAGFFSALSIMTKISSAPIILVIGLAHFFKYKNYTNKRFVNKNLLVYLIFTLLIYFIGEPGALLKLFNFLKANLYENGSTLVEQNARVGVGITFLIRYYFSATISALGWPLFLIV